MSAIEAGICDRCGGKVFHRPDKPGEFDHECLYDDFTALAISIIQHPEEVIPMLKAKAEVFQDNIRLSQEIASLKAELQQTIAANHALTLLLPLKPFPPEKMERDESGLR